MKKKNRIVLMLLMMCFMVFQCTQAVFAEDEVTETVTMNVGGQDLELGKYYITNADGTITAEGADSENYNVYYDEADGERVLYLKDATIKGVHNSIYEGVGIFYSSIYSDYSAGVPLVIDFTGDNTVTGAGVANGNSSGIRVTGAALTISGDETGTLTAIDGGTAYEAMFSQGINVAGGDLVIKSGTITAIGQDAQSNSGGIYTEDNNIYINGGTVYANCALENGEVVSKAGKTNSGGEEGFSGVGVGIYASTSDSEGTTGNVYIGGGTIYSYGSNACGIASNNNLSITDGTIYAYGGTADIANNYGIGANGNLTITGGNITAVAGEAENGCSYGIGAVGFVEIGENAVVNATGGAAADESCGIGSESGVSISGNATVNATGGTATVSSYGIGSYGEINISGGVITATGGEGLECSYGIGSAKEVNITGGVITAIGGDADTSVGISMGIGVGPDTEDDYDAANSYTLKLTGQTGLFAYGETQAIGALGGYEFGKDFIMFAGKSDGDIGLTDVITDKFTGYKYINTGAKCKVTFDGNGFESTVDEQVCVFGEVITLPAQNTMFESTGNKVLVAWDDEASDTDNKTYSVGDTYIVNGDVTLYAQWETDATNPDAGYNVLIGVVLMLMAAGASGIILTVRKNNPDRI